MRLSHHAAQQGGVFTLAQALAHVARSEVRRNVRAGLWIRQRRGIYAGRAVVQAAEGDSRRAHMLACAALLLATDEDAVVSHRSAAVAQRLPLLDNYTGPPELTLPRREGSPPLHVDGMHTAHLPTDQRTHGLVPITTPARTVADCTRTLPREGALALADAALRAGVSRTEVLAVLETCRGWPGRRQAEELVRLADARAESGLESLGRLWCHDAGLPPPDLQLRIGRLEGGAFLARVDMVWLALRTVGELDGRLKYVDPDRPDAGVSGKVLWQEKLREDNLRDAGFEVARGYWSDRSQGGQPFVERVRRAMKRAALRTDAPSYVVLAPTASASPLENP